MAFWPAVLLARSSERCRGGCAGCSPAAPCCSRRWRCSARAAARCTPRPSMLVLVFALLPGRTRTFAVLVPVGAGVAAAAPAVLRVGDHLHDGAVVPATVHSATVAMFAAAAAVAAVVALGAAVEASSRRAPAAPRCASACARSPRSRSSAVVARRAGRRRQPGARGSESAWHSFKGGYANSDNSGSRLVSGLGSNRYDFYRVALDEFDAHPLLGIGADNFQQQYLAHGRSEETPRYPHSVELRTLTQTGVIGALLALVGPRRGAVRGRARPARPRPARARPSPAAALAGFALLGGARLLRLVLGVRRPGSARVRAARPRLRARAGRTRRRALPPQPAPAASAPESDPARRAPRIGACTAWGRRLGVGGAAALALAAVASLAAPWLSQLEVQSAARIWTSAPQTAYARLDEAAELEPAQRRGVSGRGQHRAALRRTGARRARVLARARAQPRRRVRDARAGGDRLGHGRTRGARSRCSSGPCDWTRANRSPGRRCGRARGRRVSIERAEPLDPAQSSAARVKLMVLFLRQCRNSLDMNDNLR